MRAPAILCLAGGFVLPAAFRQNGQDFGLAQEIGPADRGLDQGVRKTFETGFAELCP